MRKLATIGFAFLLAGCAGHHLTSSARESQERNRLLMSEPTPSDWEIGAIWNFVQRGHDGATVLDVTFRVTNRSTETCSSGDWYELELVEGQIGNGSVDLKQAYSVSGRVLMLDLRAGWCDLGEIAGALREGSFEGQTTSGPVGGRNFRPQKVVGRRVR